MVIHSVRMTFFSVMSRTVSELMRSSWSSIRSACRAAASAVYWAAAASVSAFTALAQASLICWATSSHSSRFSRPSPLVMCISPEKYPFSVQMPTWPFFTPTTVTSLFSRL